MVKKKGGRDMNPADAFRKVQRQKEIQRNKRERQFQRDASKLKSDPDQIKHQLEEVLDLQDEGKNNLTIKLKKKALQGALDASIRKKKEEAIRAQYGDAVPAIPGEHGHGVPTQRPEDSVYYHPTLNPTGTAPPGKPQRYMTSNSEPMSAAPPVPLPKPPPLPKGPAPPWARPPPADGAAEPPLPPPPGGPPGSAALPPPPFPPGGPMPVLPPPDGPPPEAPLLPPPDEPPPALAALGRLPLPMGPPPGMVLLPPPGMPPPGMHPPPAMPPQGFAPPGAAGEEHHSREHKAVSISGQSTVAPRLPAAKDRSLTSMVPASVRVKRDAGQHRPGQGLLPSRNAAPPMAPGFGLAPEAVPRRQPAGNSTASRPGATAAGGVAKKPAQPRAEDAKYLAFMADMQQLGAIG